MEEGTHVEGARDPRLEDRVIELLGARPAALAFNGLRRSLHAHPESLARALKRLERYGLVERGEQGYRLVSAAPPEAAPGTPATPPPAWVPVAEVELAPGLGGEALLGL